MSIPFKASVHKQSQFYSRRSILYSASYPHLHLQQIPLHDIVFLRFQLPDIPLRAQISPIEPIPPFLRQPDAKPTAQVRVIVKD